MRANICLGLLFLSLPGFAADFTVTRGSGGSESGRNDYRIEYDGYTYHITDRHNPGTLGTGDIRLRTVQHGDDYILTYIPSGYLIAATCDDQTNWIAGGHGSASTAFVVSTVPELAPGETIDADLLSIESSVVGYCDGRPAITLQYEHTFEDGVFTENVRAVAARPFVVEREYLAVLGVPGTCLSPQGFDTLNGIQDLGCISEWHQEWLGEAAYLHAEGPVHVAEVRTSETLPVLLTAATGATGPLGIKGFLVRMGPREVVAGEAWTVRSSYSVHRKGPVDDSLLEQKLGSIPVEPGLLPQNIDGHRLEPWDLIPRRRSERSRDR